MCLIGRQHINNFASLSLNGTLCFVLTETSVILLESIQMNMRCYVRYVEYLSTVRGLPCSAISLYLLSSLLKGFQWLTQPLIAASPSAQRVPAYVALLPEVNLLLRIVLIAHLSSDHFA